MVQGSLLLYTTILIEWNRFLQLKAVNFMIFLLRSSMWHILLAILMSGNWFIHSSKGFGSPSCTRKWLYLSIPALFICKQNIVLQALSVPEPRFYSWSIGFATNLPLSHGCNTIPIYMDHLTKYTIVIFNFLRRLIRS